MGPITIFDKSFLQSLSLDESVWFDHFFYPVITPLFFIETLADLQKSARDGRTPEDEVRIIADKTPQMSGAPCIFHQTICTYDLLGQHTPLDGRIPMANMRSVVNSGKHGAIADISPEAQAFMRWQRGQFLEIERMHARNWRASLERTDLSVIERHMKSLGVSAKTCKSLDAALQFADTTIRGLTRSSGRFDSVLEFLEIPREMHHHIRNRWKHGKPPLKVFAPYVAHVLRVQLFFMAALGANLIASTRPSNSVDIAYLFYLPFCSLFVSTDRLHRSCASLFMRPNQEFVWGDELKMDLRALNEHYLSLPDEVKAQGIYKFASRLPDESNGLVRALFQRHAKGLLKPPSEINTDNLSPDAHKKIMDQIEKWESAPPKAPRDFKGDFDDLESLIIKRSVTRKRGAWLQIGPEVKDSE